MRGGILPRTQTRFTGGRRFVAALAMCPRPLGRILSACLLLGILNACQRNATPLPPPPAWDPLRVDGREALREAADLVNIGPRISGTPAAEQAAAHLADRLRALGLAAEVDTFAAATPTGTLTFRNVLGTIPGRDDRQAMRRASEARSSFS